MSWSGPMGPPQPRAPWRGPWGPPGSRPPAPYRPAGPAPYRPARFGPAPYRRGQYGPAPYRPVGTVYYGPRPAGRGNGCGVAVAVVAIIGVVVLVIPMLIFRGLVESVPGTSYSSHSYSTGPTTPVPPSTSEPPSPEPPQPSRSHPDGSYVNDGQTIPPHVYIEPPLPASRDDSIVLRGQSPLYGQGLAVPVRCELDPALVESMGDDQVLAIQQEFLNCLMAGWLPALSGSGHQFNTPVLLGGRGEAYGPCGQTMRFAGIYCSQIQTIYLNLDAFWDAYNSDGLTTYQLERTLAHELGHHVQHMTGILVASYWYQQGVSEDESLRENRRLELQANCFAGLGFHAVGTSLGLTDADRAALTQYSSDSQTHGTGRNRGAWLYQGMMTNQISQCNTYVVADDQVA